MQTKVWNSTTSTWDTKPASGGATKAGPYTYSASIGPATHVIDSARTPIPTDPASSVHIARSTLTPYATFTFTEAALPTVSCNAPGAQWQYLPYVNMIIQNTGTTSHTFRFGVFVTNPDATTAYNTASVTVNAATKATLNSGARAQVGATVEIFIWSTTASTSSVMSYEWRTYPNRVFLSSSSSMWIVNGSNPTQELGSSADTAWSAMATDSGLTLSLQHSGAYFSLGNTVASYAYSFTTVDSIINTGGWSAHNTNGHWRVYWGDAVAGAGNASTTIFYPRVNTTPSGLTYYTLDSTAI